MMISRLIANGLAYEAQFFARNVQDNQALFQKAGKIVKLEVTSTVGGNLRALNPWSGQLIETGKSTRKGKSTC